MMEREETRKQEAGFAHLRTRGMVSDYARNKRDFCRKGKFTEKIRF
jgi:hypothetical protein